MISICPFCGELMKHQTWGDERGLVEIDDKCVCGYHKNWAYGVETIELPDDYRVCQDCENNVPGKCTLDDGLGCTKILKSIGIMLSRKDGK